VKQRLELRTVELELWWYTRDRMQNPRIKIKRSISYVCQEFLVHLVCRVVTYINWAILASLDIYSNFQVNMPFPVCSIFPSQSISLIDNIFFHFGYFCTFILFPSVYHYFTSRVFKTFYFLFFNVITFCLPFFLSFSLFS
jgi:hypothetical protein